ncbi:MAG: relaxase/mobilization nuclease domain-containing protein [Bacilli bacterium]
MATTSMWAVKDDLKRVIDYASNPDKTENQNFNDYEYKGLQNVIEYAIDDIKTEKQFYVTGVNCSPQNALLQMEQTKKNAFKEDGVLAFHGYQSFKHGEVTPELAHQIGVELANAMWGDDFEVIVSTHLDKKHFHNHFVVNSVSWTTRKRFLNKHSDYAKFRSLSDSLCKKYQLSVIKNPKKGKHYAEWLAEKQKIPTQRTLIKDDVDRAILQSKTFTQFIKNMKAMGYVVKDNVKHIAIKPPFSDNFFRIRNITKDGYYSEESIKQRIIENKLFVSTGETHKNKIKKFHYHGNIKKAKKLIGFRALYFHYMYYMGILPKNAPNHKVHFLMKEDLRYMDKITAEVTLLCKKKINTLDDLEDSKNVIENRLINLIKERRCIYNKIRRCKNQDLKEKLQFDVKTLSNEIKVLRKEVMSYESIKNRSIKMQQKINTINKNMERKENENDRWRNSRSSS